MNKLIEVNYSQKASKSNKVVVNNTIVVPKDTPQVAYPSVAPSIVTSPLPDTKPQISVSSRRRDVSVTPTTDFWQKFAEAERDILKTVNLTLLGNIIDTTGKIIVSSDNLKTLIALITGESESLVSIKLVNDEGDSSGCCAFLQEFNPFKTVASITVGDTDFSASGFNAEYNFFTETCCIDVSTVFVSANVWSEYLGIA